MLTAFFLRTALPFVFFKIGHSVARQHVAYKISIDQARIQPSDLIAGCLSALYLDFLFEDFMPIFNHPDFFTHRQFDLENKLILPTTKLYSQISFQFNTLYQDIRTALIDVHGVVATAAKQVYAHPIETLTTWYDSGAVWYAQAQAAVLPVYQHWQVNVDRGKEKAVQYLQAFLDNPEQVAVATFDPVTRYATSIAEQSAEYWQAFMANPEQFMTAAFTPLTSYLVSLSVEAEAVLISSYYMLADLFSVLMAQPLATVQALYRNTLDALLEVYFEVISSLLVIA